MHPTPSQQNALLTAIYTNFIRPPLTTQEYRYFGVPVVIQREFPDGLCVIQTTNMQKGIPVAGLDGVLNYHTQAKVQRSQVMPAGVVAHVRSADVGSVLFA